MANFPSEPKPKPRFTKLQPEPFCVNKIYGTGACCNDRHFNPVEILPNHGGVLCKAPGVLDWESTTNRDKVNCLDCLELLHS